MKQLAEAHKVLFLCTGNYYRSRFVEILFNSLAAEGGLGWRAFSRGLATERGIHNIGPISPNALRGLQALKIPLGEPVRSPMQLQQQDLEDADVIIALKEGEHRPLVEERFAPWSGQVEYWHIDDVEQAPPQQSMAEMERLVRELIRRLWENAQEK